MKVDCKKKKTTYANIIADHKLSSDKKLQSEYYDCLISINEMNNQIELDLGIDEDDSLTEEQIIEDEQYTYNILLTMEIE